MIRIFSHYIPVKILLLVGLEALVLMASIYLGVSLRFADFNRVPTGLDDELLSTAITFTLTILIAIKAVGLYDTDFREGMSGILLRIAAAFAVGLVLMSMLFYLVPSLYLGRGAFGLALLSAFTGIVVVRLAYYHWAHLGVFRPRLLVLGAGVWAAKVEEFIHGNASDHGLYVVGYLPLTDTQFKVPKSRILPPDEPIYAVAKRNGVSEIIIAVRDRRGGGLPVQELLECRLRGIKITEISTFFERELGQVRLESLSTSWMVLGQGFRQSVVREVVKRGFDLIASSLLLALMLPVMLVAGLAIVLESGRPVFYRQERVGQGGRVFTIYKFRSMRTDAEKDGNPRWAAANDDRTTRVGRILRKLRIDELPQIINVFKGEMSFVGPRPERPFFVKELAAQIPYYSARHSIKPGITGWAQVRYAYGASLDDAIEKLQYDLYYVKNHTLFLDIMILFDTVRVVLGGKGAR